MARGGYSGHNLYIYILACWLILGEGRTAPHDEDDSSLSVRPGSLIPANSWPQLRRTARHWT